MPTQTDTLRKALEEIANPIAAMQLRAEQDGVQLNGAAAIQIANDPQYLMKIAREALASCQQAQEREQVGYDYNKTMNAILAAVDSRGATLEISCGKFWEVYAAAPAKPADPIQYLVDQAQELDMGYGKPAEQEKPYGFADFIREAKEKNLTIHDILPQLVKRCAELEVEQQAPAITEQAPRLVAKPLEDYPAADQAFYRFWYGHMLDDLMQPPLCGVDHATARYIWDAALRSEQAPAGEVPSEDSAFWQWITKESEEGREHYVFTAKAAFNAGRALLQAKGSQRSGQN